MSDVANQGVKTAPEDVAANLLGKLREGVAEQEDQERKNKPVEAKQEAKPAKVKEPEPVEDEAPEVEAREQTEAAVEEPEPEPTPWWQNQITESDPIGQTNRFFVGRTPMDLVRATQENFQLYSDAKRELERVRAEQASVEVLKELLQSKNEPEKGDPFKAELAKRGINLDTDIIANPERVFAALNEISEQRAAQAVDSKLSEYEQKKQAEVQEQQQREAFERGTVEALEAAFQKLSKEGVPYEEATKRAQYLAATAAYTYGREAMLDPNVYYRIWKETIPDSWSNGKEAPAEQAQAPEPPQPAANPPGSKRSQRTSEPSSPKGVPTLKGDQRRVAEQWGSLLQANGLISDADSYVDRVAGHLHR